jgi:hypothetical protein
MELIDGSILRRIIDWSVNSNPDNPNPQPPADVSMIVGIADAAGP